MALEDTLQAVPWPIILAGVSILVVVLLFRRRFDVFKGIGLSKPELAILCLGPIAGSAVNIPVSQTGSGILAVNLGGAIVPILMVALWVRRARLDPLLALGGTLVVSVVAKLIVAYDPQQGIYTTFPLLFAPSLVALAYAMALSVTKPLRAVPLAYTAGSMGSLLGADLYNTGPILENLGKATEPSVVSIGGAGVFDMVYLAGMVAMAAAVLLVAAMLPRGRDAASPLTYPAKPFSIPDARIVWQRFLLLREPGPRDRARAALALSDLHLLRHDYGPSLRHSFLAVDELLRGAPGLLATVRVAAPRALLHDLDALWLAHLEAERGPPDRVTAGNANRAAKLLVAALEPPSGLAVQLDLAGEAERVAG
ncbi:MAG: DUF1614 domain-containing protein [Halobacteriales archaeon]|nr:DUF1614 domain-containing protein [Halobacteriales archaeon]